MVLGDLIGTSERETPPTQGERTLTVTARGSAAAGALFVVLGVFSLMLEMVLHGLTVDAVLGGGGLAVGGGLWVVAQGLVARWISDRLPRTLLVAALWGMVAVLAAWFGWAMVVGFSWILPVVAAVVVLAECAAVWTEDPDWSSRGHCADAVEPMAEMDEATVLRWLALAALSLGVAAGVAVAVQFVHYVANWEEDLLGVFASVYLFAAVGAWCAPQLALLAWAGGRLRHAVPVVLVGAGGWAALIWAVPRFDGLGLITLALVGAALVLEVVLVCMIAWWRLA